MRKFQPKRRHHIYGPTMADTCWVNGGTARPSRCPACAAWHPDPQITVIIRRLEDFASKKGRI